MEIDIDSRRSYLDDLNQFILTTQAQFNNALDALGWSVEGVMQEKDKMVTCSLNHGHRVPERNIAKHQEKCSWKQEGYHPDDTPLPETCDYSAGSVVDRVVLGKQELARIIKEAAERNPLMRIGKDVDNRPLPRTADRLMSSFMVDERRVLYDYVITHTRKSCPVKPEELGLVFPKKEEQQRPMTRLEQMAAERDAKRRRASHRSKKVHTNRKSYSEILREVIQNQMDLFEDWMKQESEDILSDTESHSRSSSKHKNLDREDSENHSKSSLHGRKLEATHHRDTDNKHKKDDSYHKVIEPEHKESFRVNLRDSRSRERQISKYSSSGKYHPYDRDRNERGGIYRNDPNPYKRGRHKFEKNKSNRLDEDDKILCKEEVHVKGNRNNVEKEGKQKGRLVCDRMPDKVETHKHRSRREREYDTREFSKRKGRGWDNTDYRRDDEHESRRIKEYFDRSDYGWKKEKENFESSRRKEYIHNEGESRKRKEGDHKSDTEDVSMFEGRSAHEAWKDIRRMKPASRYSYYKKHDKYEDDYTKSKKREFPTSEDRHAKKFKGDRQEINMECVEEKPQNIAKYSQWQHHKDAEYSGYKKNHMKHKKSSKSKKKHKHKNKKKYKDSESSDESSANSSSEGEHNAVSSLRVSLPATCTNTSEQCLPNNSSYQLSNRSSIIKQEHIDDLDEAVSSIVQRSHGVDQELHGNHSMHFFKVERHSKRNSEEEFSC